MGRIQYPLNVEDSFTEGIIRLRGKPWVAIEN